MGPEGTANSSLEADLIAILEGIKLAKELEGRKIIAVSDCLEAVVAINEEEVM